MSPAQIRKVALIHPVRYFEAKQERRSYGNHT
jgi:hypothetical protein